MRAFRLSLLRLAARDRTAKARPSPLLEIVLVISLLTVYDKLKDLGAARRSLSVAHGFALLRLEEHLHLAIEAPANRWMSAHVLIGDLASYFYEFAWAFVAIGVLILSWVRHPHIYRPARNAMLVINAIGLAVFYADPTAPPRLLPGAGFRDTVAAAGFGVAHDGRLPADEYAAMPSLHLGWSTFAAALICRLTRNRLVRAIALTYPVVTAGVVVSSANHFVLDVVAGSALGVAACLMSGLVRLPRRTAFRAATQSVRLQASAVLPLPVPTAPCVCAADNGSAIEGSDARDRVVVCREPAAHSAGNEDVGL